MKLFKLTFFSMLLIFSSCVGGGSQEAEAEEAANEIEESVEKLSEDISGNLSGALNKLQDALKDVEGKLEEGEEVELANFRELKELLPKRLLGMDRYSHTGEKSGISGFKISQASAKYRDGDKRLEITILDSGGMALASLGAAAWTMLDVDRETDDGYERTTKIDGFKAYEKFNAKTGDAEISIFYKDRFLVSINGDNLEKGDAESVLDDLDLDELDDM